MVLGIFMESFINYCSFLFTTLCYKVFEKEVFPTLLFKIIVNIKNITVIFIKRNNVNFHKKKYTY